MFVKESKKKRQNIWPLSRGSIQDANRVGRDILEKEKRRNK